MPTIRIDDVPPEALAVLRHRAAAAGQSLEEYLRTLLISEAGRATVAEVLDRVRARTTASLSMDDTVALLREDRDR